MAVSLAALAVTAAVFLVASVCKRVRTIRRRQHEEHEQQQQQEPQICVRPVSAPRPVDFVNAAVSVPEIHDQDEDDFDDEDRYTTEGPVVKPRQPGGGNNEGQSGKRKKDDAHDKNGPPRFSSARLVLRDVQEKEGK